MRTVRVPCQVERSLFSCQCRVSFELQGEAITTICDASLLNEGRIRLVVVEECEDGSAIVTVPGELVIGWRIVKICDIPVEDPQVQHDDEKRGIDEEKRRTHSTEPARGGAWRARGIFDSFRRLKRYA